MLDTMQLVVLAMMFGAAMEKTGVLAAITRMSSGLGAARVV